MFLNELFCLRALVINYNVILSSGDCHWVIMTDWCGLLDINHRYSLGERKRERECVCVCLCCLSV